VLEELERFVDGELPADKFADLAAHIHECPPCLQRADFQAKLKEILRKKCSTTAPPAAFIVRVRQTIRTEFRAVDDV
jgi:anti-sigma factor (TIGR02949 family)